jgi:hypothetical protein
MDTTRPEPEHRHAFLRRLDELSPFWEPQVVVLAAILLDLGLPNKVTVGPSWITPAAEGVLLVGLSIISPNMRAGHAPLRRKLALALIGLVSATNIFSLGLLVHRLLYGSNSSGRELVGAGAVLWLTNVLLFGLWYWELDRGGPLARRQRQNETPDWLFVQDQNPGFASKNWVPAMSDYLYLSFTNATAFSPTDTMPITAYAKWLMSAQALASLVTVGLVLARAVNILNS